MSRYGVLPAMLLWAVPLVYAAEQEPVVFRSDVALVRVDAQVVDRDNRAITGLRAEDFLLYEQGEQRQIRNFASEDMPVDILLLLDVSGSMRPHVERVASAAQRALEVLGPEDRVAMMVFDRSTRVRMRFRGSRSDVVREFETLLRQEDFNGGTDITRALYDAAAYVGREGRREARRAIVILTDDQTERERDEAGVERALARADAVLSALLAPDAGRHMPRRVPRQGGGWPGTPPVIWGPRNPGVILGRATHSAGTAEIARRTGGDSLRVDEAAAFETTLARLRQRYALHFHLPEGARPDEERSIEVELASAARSRYPGAEVRFRRVYLSPGAQGAEPVMVTRTGSGATTTKRRRGTDQPRGGSGPIIGEPADAGRPAPAPEPPRGGWRRVDEAAPGEPPEEEPVKEEEESRGWRRLKPGEQP